MARTCTAVAVPHMHGGGRGPHIGGWGGRGHFRGGRGGRFYGGYPFYGYGGYYYGDYDNGYSCAWLKRRAQATGSRYWWARYAECLENY
ncbi:MAG: hypothetical protein WDN31_09365 [Hyphomicrobium sp.]